MNYIITGPNFVSPLLRQLEENKTAFIINEQDLSKPNFKLKNNDIIYATAAERTIELLNKHQPHYGQLKMLNTLRDKYTCRKFLQTTFPDYSYGLYPIDKTKLDPNKKYILKPRKGFFGKGIRTINNLNELDEQVRDIQQELKNLESLFGKGGHDQAEFIIEEYISGDEYAADMYFDSNGNPVILNFTIHPMHQQYEYLHTLYYTSQEIHEQFYQQVIDMLTNFNQQAKITNMAMHAEFRLNNNQLVPIEFNLLRFGGFGYADFGYYAFNFHSLEYFFTNQKPDWKNIWKTREYQYYAWILGYNGKDIDTNTTQPNKQKFLKQFSQVLHFYDLNYRKNPAFGIAFIATNDQTELLNTLSTEFNQYFIE